MKSSVFGLMLFWCNFLAFAEVSARDWVLQKWSFVGHPDQSLILSFYLLLLYVYILNLRQLKRMGFIWNAFN
jgi:hypothetical protein